MLNHKTIKAILLALCLISLAGAGEKKEATKIELVPIYEKTFDDTIVDVIFAEAEVSVKEARILGWRDLEEKKSEEKTTLVYPEALVKQGKIEFLDVKGALKMSFPLTPLKGSKPIITVNFSKNRRYIGIVKSRKEFTMLNDNGELLWQTDISRVGYGWPYISPDGQYIVCVGDITGDFTDYYPSVWDKNGFAKGLVKEDGRTDYELLDLDFTENGDYFVTTFKQKGYTKKERYLDSLILCLFDRKGNKVWQKMVGRGSGGYVSISENGNYIAVVIWPSDAEHQELHLYNNQGTFCWKSEVGAGQSYFIFSHDDSILTVCCGWAFLCQFDIQTGKRIWLHQGMGIYRSVIPAPDGQLYIVFGFNRKTGGIRLNDFILVFNRNGELLIKKEFLANSLYSKYPSSYIPAPGCFPTTLFAEDNLMLLCGNENKIISLKVVEEK